jgi:hypothetical protein
MACSILSILKSWTAGSGGPDGRGEAGVFEAVNGKNRRGDMVEEDWFVVSSALPEYALTRTG